MKHKHYEVLTQWLADQTLELEYRRDAGEIWSRPPLGNLSPITAPKYEWRIKPKMVKVGRHEWPMPEVTAPAMGAIYWVAYPGSKVEAQWANNSIDRDRLGKAIVHLPQLAAQQHANALLSINRGDV